MLRKILQLVLLPIGSAFFAGCQPEPSTSSTPAQSTQALQLENDRLKQENDSLQKLLESERMTPRADRSQMPPTPSPLPDSASTL